MAKKIPDHARNFQGKAKNIPERDMFMLPYQARWIADRSLMKIMEKSRRVGVSYGTSYDFVREHATKGANLDTWFSSRDDLTAREFIVYCKAFAATLDRGAKDLGMQVVDDKGNSARVLSFATGTRINSLASNPDVFAGKGGNVGLDELALRDDPRAVVAIAQPVIDWGGRMAMISTHRGSHNYFNQIVQEILHKGNPKGFSHHRVTLQDALDQHFLWKLQTKLRPEDPRMAMDEADYFNYQRSRSADEETFLQEYMCVPSDDAAAFLSYELIAGCQYKPEEEWETDLKATENPLFLGVDVGRDHDLTVFWLVERAGGVNLTRRVICMQAETFSAQEEVFYELLSLPGLRRCCVDQTGIGRQFAERAAERFGTYRVEGVTFTAAVKDDLATPVRAAFEDKSVRIPDDDLIRSDLRAIKKETTASGNIRFTADRGKNGHADRFWALSLALHAAKNPGGTSDLQPVKRGNRRFQTGRKIS